MSDKNIPADAPPSYDEAAGSSSASASRPQPQSTPSKGAGLHVPSDTRHQNGSIPADRRRSMEDENRPIPKGWIRSFDPQSHHQFFVDTTKDPPRSIWIHPYDDEQYLSTLPSHERERIEQESMGRGHPPSKADIMAEHTDEEDDSHHTHSGTSSSAELPPRPDAKGKKAGGFGRKLKDKVTGTTHEQREQERQRRAQEEQRLYEQHQRLRQAMAEAAQTGKPVHFGKDKEGKDVYVEPPMYDGGAGYPGAGGYGAGYGVNPYQGGIYSTPNARYIRPSAPYGRPYGSGYGGGYGLPIGLGVGGGLLGGMLMGDMMFGGMGGMGMGGMGMGMGGMGGGM